MRLYWYILLVALIFKQKKYTTVDNIFLCHSQSCELMPMLYNTFHKVNHILTSSPRWGWGEGAWWGNRQAEPRVQGGNHGNPAQPTTRTPVMLIISGELHSILTKWREGKWSRSISRQSVRNGHQARANDAKCAERCPMGMGSRDCKQWPLTVDRWPALTWR